LGQANVDRQNITNEATLRPFRRPEHKLHHRVASNVVEVKLLDDIFRHRLLENAGHLCFRIFVLPFIISRLAYRAGKEEGSILGFV